jgi:hypothetical protein
MEFQGFLAYLLTKFAAYSGWCYVGLRWFDSSRDRKARGSLFYGFLRCDGGLFWDGNFLAALTMNNAVKNSILTYFVVLRSSKNC